MKKNWIYLKRGLSQDPKHRENMGPRVWLYLHLIDRADWETGIVYGWKDKDEAADMCMEWRTLQRQRQELQELGYITCRKGRGHQDITVYNWTNPKNYSGEVVNPREYAEMRTPESTPESTPRPNTKVRTPSIEIISHKPPAPNGAKPEEAVKARIAQAISEGEARHYGLTSELERAFHITPNWERKDARTFLLRLKEIRARQEDVRRFAAWWYANDWRGKSGNTPTISQMSELWPQAFIETDAPSRPASYTYE